MGVILDDSWGQNSHQRRERENRQEEVKGKGYLMNMCTNQEKENKRNNTKNTIYRCFFNLLDSVSN